MNTITVLDCETCNDDGSVLECLCGCGHSRLEDLCPMRRVECSDCGGRWPDGRWKEGQ